MWWYLLPVGVVAGAATYSLIRSADRKAAVDDGHEHPDPEAVVPPPPDFWAYLLRWGKIFEDAEQDLPALPPPPPPATLSTSERIEALVTPTRLTAMTAIAVVAVTIWNGMAPGPVSVVAQVVLLGALVGIGTNWLAIKMLFRPINPLFGVQGVIPANRERIIDAMARGVARNLLDRETIRAAVHDSDIVRSSIDEVVIGLKRLVESERFRSDLSDLVREAVVAFVRNNRFRQQTLETIARLGRLVPSQVGPMPSIMERAMGSLFERLVKDRGEDVIDLIEKHVNASVRHAGDEVIGWLESLPEGFDERRPEIEAVITDSVARRASSFDIEGLVRDKLSAYSPEDLEDLLLRATDTHLSKIQYFGWILGAIAAPLVKGLETLITWLAG